MFFSRRLGNFLGFGACAGLMGYALFAQHVLYYDPCPLCTFQRVGVIATGVVFLLAALHHPGRLGARIYAVFTLLAAAGGGAVAAWHIRMQNLPPDQVPDCGPGLGYMLESFPFGEVLKKVFTGSGECADIVWQFLGLSMPGWVLVWCVFLGAFAMWNNWRAAD